MNEIKCSMCGKPNPDDLEACQFCDARLLPLTDELSRSQPPIQPGAKPTPIDTGELEPILPQWLQEVRQKARDSAESEEERLLANKIAAQKGDSVDLLAGLQADDEDNEEIPDWLSGLRDDGSVAALENEISSEDIPNEVTKELDVKSPISHEGDASSLPGWVSNLDDSNVAEQTKQDEFTDFLANVPQEDSPQTEPSQVSTDSSLGEAAEFGFDTTPETDSNEGGIVKSTDLPEWLQGTDEEPVNEVGGNQDEGIETDQLANVGPIEANNESPQIFAGENETPDWLTNLGDESAEAPSSQPAVDDDMPDWLSSTGGGEIKGEIAKKESAQPAGEVNFPNQIATPDDKGIESSDQQQPTAESDLPNWLSSVGEESVEETALENVSPQQAVEDQAFDGISVPSDESQIPERSEPESETAFVADEFSPAFDGEIPDWLSSLGDESDTALQPKEFKPPAVEEEVVDGLSPIGGEETKFGQAANQPEPPALMPEDQGTKPVTQSALVNDEGDAISSEDVDAIFSMEMPEWLSDTSDKSEDPGSAFPEATQELESDLDPADLPSWVQAMRPIESVISETTDEIRDNQPLEKNGPLAGLRGVLPAVSGLGPTSKPKAYTIKLQANEEQQSSAIMLENILREEIDPKSIVTQKIIFSQRVLRWLITGLLLLVVSTTFYSGIQISPILAPSNPSKEALNHITKVLPQGAPVLLIFDYETALAGELEASALPLVDHMLTLKHPRLCLISSTPTGTGLAERFMKKLQQDREYKRKDNFVNLGFLPGGAAGVLAFAENPKETKPFSMMGESAWATPALQNISNLSNFATIILLTDDLETTRIWIEQTEKARGNTEFLVISSAQSGPMILPYHQSDQVDGMVVGINDSAYIEQINSGRPGMVRRYWDAYGLGLTTAVVLISLGSIWSLISGWQARRKERIRG